MFGGVECWRWGSECRFLNNNALIGPVPSELGLLNELRNLYVQTALNRPTRGVQMWGVPIRLAERTSRSIDIEWWRVPALRGASSDGCGGAAFGGGVESAGVWALMTSQALCPLSWAT